MELMDEWPTSSNAMSNIESNSEPPGQGASAPAEQRASTMGLPLWLRVVALVTAFNVVVFGGLLVWFTHIITDERAELAQLDEQLVLERLRNLLDEKGQALIGEILSWSRWSRYEDAQIVQLRSFEASGGLLSDLRRVPGAALAGAERPPLVAPVDWLREMIARAGNHFAEIQHDDAVGNRHHRRHIVFHKQDGYTSVAHGFHQFDHIHGLVMVHAGKRFVQ